MTQIRIGMQVDQLNAWSRMHALRGEYGRVIATCTQSLHQIESAEIYNRRGWACWQLGELDKALQDFNRAIALDSRCIAAYLNRGQALYQQGVILDALADFNLVIYYDPQQALAYSYRARIDADQGNPMAAILDYKQYLALGGGRRHGDQTEVERLILTLRDAAHL